MFKKVYQSGLLSIFYSCGAKPLELWDVEVKNGHIKRLTDSEVRSVVLEICGSNVSTTYITCPKGSKVLGITLPYMVMIVKNLKKHFTFEVTVIDQTGARRRFRISNFQSKTQILPLCTTMPITLNEGWNQIQFDLAEFTKRSYKTQFMEVAKLKINANIRLRRVYFTEALLPDDRLPPEFKLYLPLETTKVAKGKPIKEEEKGKENIKSSPSQQTASKPDQIKGSKIDGSKLSIRSLKKPSSDDQNLKTKVEVEEPSQTIPIDVKSAVEVPTTGEAPLESEAAVLTEPVNEAPIDPEVNGAEIVLTEPVAEGEATLPVNAVPTETVSAEQAPVEADVLAETGAATEETMVTETAE